MRQQTQLKKHIQAYLNEAKMMQLASVGDNGRPWACSVWFAHRLRSKYLLAFGYFTSSLHRTCANPHVSAAICLSQSPKDNARGLQIEGSAVALTKPAKIAHAMQHYAGRIFTRKQVEDFMAHPDRPHSFYRPTPEALVLFDTVNYPSDPRQEYRP
ncbi:MAG: pyridoxamine 5'-phosphate oxidase family protein [Candidatus Saccharimonadales bacterium]|jgi:hypothetical protein